MRNFALMILAAVMVLVFTIPALAIQSIRYIVRRYPLSDLWFTTTIGLDQLGGAIIYAEPDWTISRRTYYLSTHGNRAARIFERAIKNMIAHTRYFSWIPHTGKLKDTVSISI